MWMLAHAGHVFMDLGIYGTPVALVVGALCISTARERRRTDDDVESVE
jgi:hypothetical protein